MSTTPETMAFASYLRTGREAMQPEEARALIASNGTSGGYLAPPEFHRQFLRRLAGVSPIRSVARAGGIYRASSVIVPQIAETSAARWTGRDKARAEPDVTYGRVEIVAHKLACSVDISLRTIEGAIVDVEAEVTAALVERFGQIEATAFMVGTGVKQPLGILTAPGVPEFANGHATNLSADALVKLMYALPAQYRNRGTWMMNSTTLKVVRILRDGNGDYLWQPGLQAGQPGTLLGRPVLDAADMPNVAPGDTPVLFGDISAAYQIYDQEGMGIWRAPHSGDGERPVHFHAWRRVGGGVVQPAALRKLKMVTA